MFFHLVLAGRVAKEQSDLLLTLGHLCLAQGMVTATKGPIPSAGMFCCGSTGLETLTALGMSTLLVKKTQNMETWLH